MQELILTVGLPASGKTTWANEWIKNHPDYVNVNRDDIRLALQGRGRYNKFSKWRESIVTTVAAATVEAALAEGKSVIISDTNLNPGRNEVWKTFAKEHKIAYREELFTDIHCGECIDRDARREFPVGQRVITGMFEKGRGIWFPEVPQYNHELDDCYVCDIDGTLAHMNGRGPYEWMKVDSDLPDHNVIGAINRMKETGATIVIVSGRDGVCKDLTIEWLHEHGVQYNEFYIRPAADNRKDTLIKEEIYNNHIKDRYNVIGVYDDRDQVVHMWRHLGLRCFQVNYGRF